MSRVGVRTQFFVSCRGGTGTIWSELGSRLPEENIVLNTEVREIDSENQSSLVEMGNSSSTES